MVRAATPEVVVLADSLLLEMAAGDGCVEVASRQSVMPEEAVPDHVAQLQVALVGLTPTLGEGSTLTREHP